MTKSNLNAWQNYLFRNIQTPQKEYHYPATEGITDDLEDRQDPLKRRRELMAISDATPSNAEVVFDFGCGIGRNFDALRKSVRDSEDVILIGIEPDKQRANIAAQNDLGFDIFHGNIEIIERAPQNNRIDHFLCCQVLGHTTTSTVDRIIKESLIRMSKTGAAHFCIPFVNFHLRNTKDDFFHVVDLGKKPEDKGFRAEVTVNEFDRITSENNTGNFLPVRAFSAVIPENIELNAPLPLTDLPHTIRKTISESFCGEAMIYSVHSWHREIPYIGDVSIVIRRIK